MRQFGFSADVSRIGISQYDYFARGLCGFTIRVAFMRRRVLRNIYYFSRPIGRDSAGKKREEDDDK
jgi:hypothetical protein